MALDSVAFREENNININFWCESLVDIPDPYARMPRGQKVSPHHRSRRKTHFLGTDIHDPKGSRETLSRKSLR